MTLERESGTTLLADQDSFVKKISTPMNKDDVSVRPTKRMVTLVTLPICDVRLAWCVTVEFVGQAALWTKGVRTTLIAPNLRIIGATRLLQLRPKRVFACRVVNPTKASTLVLWARFVLVVTVYRVEGVRKGKAFLVRLVVAQQVKPVMEPKGSSVLKVLAAQLVQRLVTLEKGPRATQIVETASVAWKTMTRSCKAVAFLLLPENSMKPAMKPTFDVSVL